MSTLFDLADVKARERLASSSLGALRDDEIVVDLFCGGGGATQGIEDAGLMVHECVNHCATAIETHAANHPATYHRRGDVWKNTPESVAAGRPVGLLWASPDCRHFSRARGAAPVSRRVRDLAWVVTRWAVDAAPRVIIVENVGEFVEWGPTRARRDERGREIKDAQGRVVMEPIPERKGETFRRWRRKLERAGYVVEHRVLDAADYGAASRRRRLFVIARRDGAPICWPEKTHGALGGSDHVRDARTEARAKGTRHARTGVVRNGDGLPEMSQRGNHYERRTQGVFGGVRSAVALQPHRAAAEIIDWSDLGTSIFERRRALADKTLARIAEGVRRYVLNDARPFVLRVTQTGAGGGWKVSSVADAMPTQTTRQDLAVVTPIVQAHRGNATARSAAEPLPTITAGNGPGRGAGAGHSLSVISPVLAPQNGGVFGQRVDEPGPTITTKGHQALVSALLMHNTTHHTGGRVSAPIPTVTTGGQTGLVAPVLGVLRNNGTATPVDAPAPTVTSGGNHAALVAALLVKFYGSETGGANVREPLGTCTTRDRHGLVCVVVQGVEYVIVDILFRMLKPRELAAAMGFPARYVWPATQREAVRLIGNAVSPPMACALTRAVFPSGVRARARRSA